MLIHTVFSVPVFFLSFLANVIYQYLLMNADICNSMKRPKLDDFFKEIIMCYHEHVYSTQIFFTFQTAL